MSIVDTVKKWPVSIAFAAGLTVGGGAVYEVSQDKYADDAVLVEATDTLIAAHKNPVYEDVQVIVGKDTTIEKVVVDSLAVSAFVARPLLRHAWSGVKQGDILRAVLFVNGEITAEFSRTITEAALAPNDGFSAVLKLDVREDRIAPMPEPAEEPVELIK